MPNSFPSLEAARAAAKQGDEIWRAQGDGEAGEFIETHPAGSNPEDRIRRMSDEEIMRTLAELRPDKYREAYEETVGGGEA